jgi:broad specificity phosphatase PhoE
VIVLCRHGATDQNLAGEFLSAQDPPLNAAGRAQCERLRAELQTVAFRRGFCSPKRRCLESATIIAPGVVCETRNELLEVDFGDWEGKTKHWLAEHDAERLSCREAAPATFRHPNGESFADVAKRLAPFVNSVIGTDENVLIVGHRGTLGVLERLLRGLRIDSQEVRPMEPGEFRVLG